jgi:hypothetical protein
LTVPFCTEAQAATCYDCSRTRRVAGSLPARLELVLLRNCQTAVALLVFLAPTIALCQAAPTEPAPRSQSAPKPLLFTGEKFNIAADDSVDYSSFLLVAVLAGKGLQFQYDSRLRHRGRRQESKVGRYHCQVPLLPLPGCLTAPPRKTRVALRRLPPSPLSGLLN